MTALVAAHLALVAGYAGLQSTVRGLVYPQFASVPAEAWLGHHREHSRRIARLVGPLFAGQLLTTCWLLVDRPAGVPLTAVVTGALCLLAVLGITGLAAVPQHRRLGERWDPLAYRRLLRADSARLVAALGGVAAAVWVAVG